MQYTLKQACDALTSSTHAYGVRDVKDAVNRAVRALAGMAPWECLRKTLRFMTAGPEFSLPQGCAGLVRVCVNGHPKTLRGRDFRFLQSGPGEIDRPPYGFVRFPPANVLDMGWTPTMVDIGSPSRLFAFSNTPDEPPLYVRGVDPAGREIRAAVRPYRAPTPDGTAGTAYEDAVPTDEVFSVVTDVVVDDNATDYATLYAVDAGLPHLWYGLGLYHPEIKAPQFRRYRLQGVPPGRPSEILAEVRVDPVPLVRDTDVLPVGALEPVEWMIRYDWCMKASEVDAAAKYQAQAAQWLKSQEVVEDTVQSPIVVNGLFENSLGEVSMEAYNV